MYNLQRVNADNWQQYPVLQQFYDDLPKKPYCAPCRGVCYINPKELAIREHYIQPNHPAVARWLCFDIDSPNGLLTFYDNSAPAPQIIMVNPHNGHAHYCYRLVNPVGLIGNSKPKPIGLLQATYQDLRATLGADRGYSGNLIKNPFAKRMWETYITNTSDYTLDELGDLPPLAYFPASNDDYLGRNVAVFNHTRHRAYAITHNHSYDSLLKELLEIARNFNETFDSPLFDNEIYTICKSITRYCKSSRFSNGGITEAHREVQRMRGSKGGKKSKRRPVAHSERSTKPWIALGISRATYYRDLNRNNSQK